MSLATRCPACGTVFRVVQDQLKVSEGWVRCGRCAEVFNAVEGLFDMDAQGGAAPAQAPAPARAVPAPETAADPAGEPAVEAAEVDRTAEVRSDGPSTDPPVETVAPPQAPAAPDPDEAQSLADLQAAYRFAEPAIEPAIEAAIEPAADALIAPADTPPIDVLAGLRADAPPDFIRRADAAARWRHPARRITLALLALVLAAVLAAQIALHYRDGLAANWPAARPALQAGCELLGCRIEPPRRVEALSVDSSGLVRLEGTALYRLSLVLHNKAPVEVMMPAIDLVLSDSRGQTLLRRVLNAAELGSERATLPAQGEVPLQATMDLGDRRVAGYTIELFYP